VIHAYLKISSALATGSRYILRYTTSLIPEEAINFAHSLHGKCKQYIVVHCILCSWFCTIAFASACVAKQCQTDFTDRSTHAASLLQNHCSWQLGTQGGFPLYHEAIILLSFTMTAQELNLIQLARVAAMIADNIKY